MNSVAKQTVIAVLALVIATPVMAAEINKGTKSYQTRTEKSAEQVNAAAETPADVADIAPAAGATEEQVKQKAFKEELRLPRKN